MKKLSAMGKKIKERRSLIEDVKCAFDETFASESCCGVLEKN